MADELTDKTDADLARVLDLYAAAIGQDYSRSQFRTWDRLNAVMCEAARRLRTPPTPEAGDEEIARELCPCTCLWAEGLEHLKHCRSHDQPKVAAALARVRKETEERCAKENAKSVPPETAMTTFWREEARRFAQNANYWRERTEKAEAELSQLHEEQCHGSKP